MNLKTILGPAFLVLCLAAAGLVVATGPAKPTMQGFTLYISQTTYPVDGAPIPTATKVRRQKSDGSWKLETSYVSGKFEVTYGQPGSGVFAVDAKNRKLEYLSHSSSRPLADIDWSKRPGFAGEETILGYKTYRIRSENDGQYTDSYLCPALQGYPLRVITGNARAKTVWETTQVIPGEPVFEDVPTLPVSTKRFEEKNKQ
jgi:hypothetical protein